MKAILAKLTVLAVFGQIACASAADPEKQVAHVSAQEERACAGVANESLKMRELKREVGMYFDQPMPDELQRRVKRHFDTVARLKAECDQQRGSTALVR
jgi:hypothetical protein